MDKESKSASGGLSGNGIIAVVLLAAGVLFVREVPLETTRLPVNEPRLQQQTSTQDTDARLWQDPFGAVARAREEARKNDPKQVEAEDQRRNALLKEIEGFASPVQILAVLLPAGPYSENVESRRRSRYAVLAGLDANRLTPSDTEHIGYFYPPSEFRPVGSTNALQPIPYEWFEPADALGPKPAEAPGSKPVTGRGVKSQVLVMWIQSEALGNRPLLRLGQLAQPFAHLKVQWRILGPNASDGLKDMIDEVNGGFKVAPVHAAMRFYSLNATVPDKVLLKGAQGVKSGESLSEFFKHKNIDLIRTIGDDAGLAESLTQELMLRGLTARSLDVDPATETPDKYGKLCRLDLGGVHARPSRIAVVAEWDTLYGRTLRQEFKADKVSAGFCVDRFSYVRGLDGQLPTRGDSPSAPGTGLKPPLNGSDAARRKDGTFIEQAEGQSQFDYLRRLSVQIRERDRQARQMGGDAQGYRAIGVLGSDLHDKLLVLQALRPEFPDVIFFTTDLDARYLHPHEQPWTRNLVIASNFGLRLTEGLQSGAPPFRDSYQTSAFLSTRIAMDDARRALQPAAASEKDGQPLAQKVVDNWLLSPRVFEIGRTEAFDFTGRVFDPKLKAGEKSGCRGSNWRVTCDDVHPSGSRRYPSASVPVLTLVFAALLFVLWAPVYVLFRKARQADQAGARPRRGNWVLFALLALGVLPLGLAFCWNYFADWLTEAGKPLVLLEGISLWPTEALRLFTLLLCLYLIVRGWLVLSRNLDEINSEFHSGAARRDLIVAHLKADLDLPTWQRVAQFFSMEFVPRPRGGMASTHGMTAAAVDFWGRHIVQNRIGARLARTSLCVVLAALASGLVMWAIDNPRFVPLRGVLSFRVHEWLRWPALLMVYFLVFFVVDATVLCVRFVDGLRVLHDQSKREVNWPNTTLHEFGSKLWIPTPFLEDWIDLQFIARRTRCVTALIYYPFIVISLWLLSRNLAFDRWTWSIGSVFPAAIGAAVAVACAVLLRRAAEASRAQAITHIQDALMRLNATSDATNAEAMPRQLELLRTRIENLQEGAFAPFWQQPLLKAVLLPFATLGGTSVLEAMRLANL